MAANGKRAAPAPIVGVLVPCEGGGVCGFGVLLRAGSAKGQSWQRFGQQRADGSRLLHIVEAAFLIEGGRLHVNPYIEQPQAHRTENTDLVPPRRYHDNDSSSFIRTPGELLHLVSDAAGTALDVALRVYAAVRDAIGRRDSMKPRTGDIPVVEAGMVPCGIGRLIYAATDRLEFAHRTPGKLATGDSGDATVTSGEPATNVVGDEPVTERTGGKAVTGVWAVPIVDAGCPLTAFVTQEAATQPLFVAIIQRGGPDVAKMDVFAWLAELQTW
jgi:hypothetical protein